MDALARYFAFVVNKTDFGITGGMAMGCITFANAALLILRYAFLV